MNLPNGSIDSEIGTLISTDSCNTVIIVYSLSLKVKNKTYVKRTTLSFP